ncbi:uncharacterized protein LOC143284665 [Babylonia areolata]|uniref:uncharacterized protein LOC143284665 n=1 Tax=Babylonia areolata TaxID=304850 RepID=UPI003FD386A0
MVVTQPSDDLQTKVKEQVKVMEAVMSRLSEEEKEIERQRRIVELDIRQRYEIGLRMLDECRDQSLTTMEEATGQLTDKLQADRISAHSLLKPLQDLARKGASGQDSSDSVSDTPSALLSDPVLRHFRQLSTASQRPPPPLFLHSYSDNMADITDSFRQFLGTVVPSGGSANPQLSGSSVGWKKRSSDQGAGGTAGDGDPKLSQQHRELRSLQVLMNQMQTDLDHLRKEFTGMKQSVTDDMAAMKNKMPVARDATDSQQTELARVMAEMDSLRRDVTAVQSDVASTAADVEIVQRETTDIQKDASKKQQSLDQIDTVIKMLQSQMNAMKTPVFFNTQLTEDTDLSKSEIVKLKKVVSQTGRGYNATTGIFTAPLSGTYLFVATARADLNSDDLTAVYAMFYIVAGGEKVAASWSKGPTSCTAHAVVKLQAGDRAYLQTFEDRNLYTFRGEGHTSFSGVLLHTHV